MHELKIASSRRLFLHTHSTTDQYVSREIETTGIWEPCETGVVLRHLRPGHVFVDVGANIGYYSVIAGSLVGPSGTVFAFEPDPTNNALLRRNVELNRLDNTVVVNQALSDGPGEERLYLCEENKGDHRLYDSADGRPGIAVECVDLDSFVERRETHVDFVKIDAQGSETRILKGMQRLLQRDADRLRLILEVWPFGLGKSGSSTAELLGLLPVDRWDLYVINEDARTVSPVTPEQILSDCEDVRYREWQGFTNVLCLPRGSEVL